MVRRYFPKTSEELVHWYERYISPLSLVLGFFADNLILLRRVDLWTTNALFLFYLCVASCGIVLINFIESGRLRGKWAIAIAPFIPIVIQFCFGGLFSGFLSLYSRSAEYLGSWIFIALVAALLLGNERLSRFYVRVPVQLSILFSTLFLFFIFFLPVLFHQIGPWMFAFSGISALCIIAIFLLILLRLIPEIRTSLAPTLYAIAGMYVLLNILYFTNIIPPLPLSLKDAGVYHSVVHEGTAYLVEGEHTPLLERIIPIPTTFHESPGDTVFIYTSIFAPSGLSTTVVNEWQWYDSAQKAWKTQASITYAIQGGRDGGYEGYSEYPTPQSGAWRVNILTGYGQLIGRVSFKVVLVDTPPILESASK